MYLDNTWYALKVLPQYKSADPVKGLDVSILQDQLLGPVLGIGDPRTDKRIDFIGGIRGLKELERRVSEDMEIAFSMYPTSIEELLSVAGLFLCSGNIFRLIYPPPFFGALYFYSFTLVPAQEFDQFVAVDPDLMVTFFL